MLRPYEDMGLGLYHEDSLKDINEGFLLNSNWNTGSVNNTQGSHPQFFQPIHHNIQLKNGVKIPINHRLDKLSAIGHSTSEHQSLQLFENMLKSNYLSHTQRDNQFEK